MQHNRQITISTATSRKALDWIQQTLWWSEFIDKLRVPVKSPETLADYLALPKGDQNELKDVGGFVGGALSGRRKAHNIKNRDLITLDLDQIPAGGTDDVLRRLSALNCGYAVYSTRKHEPAAPRLRVVLPTDRPLAVDEYQPVARKLAELIGLNLCDPTTFEAHRLMYWPSCSSNSQYIFQFEDKPFLSADGVLALYGNAGQGGPSAAGATDGARAAWQDVSQWPDVPGEKELRTKTAARQGDPEEKTGVIGAFCKCYDVYAALDAFLPGEYAATDIPGRYTYTHGTTAGGAVVYDDGKFLYSHHSTDPTSGQLVNAFDLVRLHKFGHLDEEAKAGTPTHKIPSYLAMCEFALQQEPVADMVNRERYEKATRDLSSIAGVTDVDWMKVLIKSKTSLAPVKTIKNVLLALEYDPRLKGRILWDEFSEFIMGVAPLPWAGRDTTSGLFKWTDADYAGIRSHIEAIFDTRGKDLTTDAVILCATAHSYNPVTAYLSTIQWDGTPRLDTLYIEYLGAEDCAYTRAVTRKAIVAAVARAFNPGIKFDCMTVICGKQGIGKSTLFAKLGRGWFSDSVRTFEGKEAAELIQGVWIVEISEMEAFDKADVRAVKSFLSKCDDQYRAAYGRIVEKHPRRCVFFGTTNDHDFLKDATGNRRFWPVDALIQEPTKSVFKDLTDNEINQLWAEAVAYYRQGEPLYLPNGTELEGEAEKRREEHFDRDPLQGQIEEFLSKAVPEDWQKWELARRNMFWGGGLKYEGRLVPRDRICAAEVWQECFNNRYLPQRHEALRINRILEQLKGWERSGNIRVGVDYGTQKGFRRVNQVGAEVLTLSKKLVHTTVNLVNEQKA